MTYICRIADQLQQDARNFPLPTSTSFGHFKPAASKPNTCKVRMTANPTTRAQPFELAHAAFDPQNQAVIEILSERTHPLAPAPTPASCLLLRQNEKRRGFAPSNKT